MNKKINTFLTAVLVVCFCAFPLAGMSNVRASGAPAPALLPFPVPYLPSGTIAYTRPTFTWFKVDGATEYRLAVYAGTHLAYPLQTLLTTSCNPNTATECSYTPAITLRFGAYTWQVQAYVGTSWTAYSFSNAFTVTYIPVPVNPHGSISGPLTLQWKPLAGALLYSYSIYKGSAQISYNIVDTSVCGPSVCSVTPQILFSAGVTYSWKVRADLGKIWHAFSLPMAFTIGGFDSEFTSDAAGWIPVAGNWTVGSGYYQATPADSGSYLSSAYADSYNILAYQARVGVIPDNCHSCVFGLFFNGVPTPAGTALWYTGYYFGVSYYNGLGFIEIWQVIRGKYTSIMPWRFSAVVAEEPDCEYDPSCADPLWNTLKVTYNSSTHYAQFYMNGYMVAYGTFSSISSGQVGIASTNVDPLYVDDAKLSLTAPTKFVSPGSDAVEVDDSLAATAATNPGMPVAP
ncbi:MAG: hypothetical protein WCE68_15260 [Anaerolineales bacterium]